jgi:hypothetical protein
MIWNSRINQSLMPRSALVVFPGVDMPLTRAQLALDEPGSFVAEDHAIFLRTSDGAKRAPPQLDRNGSSITTGRAAPVASSALLCTKSTSNLAWLETLRHECTPNSSSSVVAQEQDKRGKVATEQAATKPLLQDASSGLTLTIAHASGCSTLGEVPAVVSRALAHHHAKFARRRAHHNAWPPFHAKDPSNASAFAPI